MGVRNFMYLVRVLVLKQINAVTFVWSFRWRFFTTASFFSTDPDCLVCNDDDDDDDVDDDDDLDLER